MKTIITGALIIILVVSGFIIYNSTRWQTYTAEGYQAPSESFKIVKLSEIRKSPDSFNEKNILLEGRITRVCPTGCWFYLEGDAGEIKIELAAGKFVIPQSAGKNARVYGKLEVNDTFPVIIGSKIQIR